MGFMERLSPTRPLCCGARNARRSGGEKKLETSTDSGGAEAPGGGGSATGADGGRAQWSSPTEFLLTCIGYSVGLGNVWRFPYLCYKSGGGAFLIPYIIMMMLIGMPLLFMEYGFGQYFGVGSLTIFKKVCPAMQGIGVGYVVVNGLVCVYYNVIIAISLYYFFGSLTNILPWSTCNNAWNTPFCGDPITSAPANASLGNGTESNVTSALLTVSNVTNNISLLMNDSTRKSPSDEYYRLEVLRQGDEHNISNLGDIQWKLCLCLLLAWILVVLFVSRGIKSTGKVAYFTATFPYVMLTVLVVRGVTLPGATNGILYFITPVWSKLLEPEVWFAASTQLFYSTNLAWGGMITMASYNSFNHNCYRDAIMINIVSFLTSLYAGFAVFSIIGYMAGEYGLDIEDVIKSGPGLAFVVYPRALSLMPLAPMWSALFFFMLFLLGIGSQMVQVETILTAAIDKFAVLGRSAIHRISTAAMLGFVFFLLALPCCCQGGMYVLQLMDWFSAGFSVLCIAIVECFTIHWLYGNARFSSNIKEMLGKFPRFWWRICWRAVSPLIIIGILVFTFVEYKPAEYGKYIYPVWAQVLGWLMSLSSVLPIFIIAAYKIAQSPGTTFKEKWSAAITPILSIEAKKVCTIEVDQIDKKSCNGSIDPIDADSDAETAKKRLIESENANDTSVV